MSKKPVVFNYNDYLTLEEEVKALRATVANLEIRCRIAESEKPKTGPYESDGVYYTEDGGRLYTGDEVRKIINGTVSDVRYGITDPYDILPQDFV